MRVRPVETVFKLASLLLIVFLGAWVSNSHWTRHGPKPIWGFAAIQTPNMTQTAPSDHFQCLLSFNLQFSPALKVKWSGLQEYFPDWFHSLSSPTLQSILHTAAGVIGLKKQYDCHIPASNFLVILHYFQDEIQAFQCGSYHLDAPVLPTSTTTWSTTQLHHFCLNFLHLLEILHTSWWKYCYGLTKSHFTFFQGNWQK